MTGIIAATSSGGAEKLLASVPIVLIFVAAVAVMILIQGKMGTLLKVITFALGIITGFYGAALAFPKLTAKVTALTTVQDRAAEDIFLVLLIIGVLTVAFMEKGKGAAGGGGE